MTFLERYESDSTWHGRATIMRLYHMIMCQNNKTWRLRDTALSFECSIGLVSENISLAEALDNNPKLMECKSRAEALKKVR